MLLLLNISTPCNYSTEVVRKPSSLFSPNSVKLPKSTSTCNKNFFVKSSMSINKGQGLGREVNGSVLGEKDAVIIVDHGSRRKESNLMLSRDMGFLVTTNFFY